ncbi:uncharacterized protein LOC108673043 [Hyalella azteca]|uniref:Uncharacterized protein LOC108673043 n=1 Tax=Hyalella azteca TaxID=294128 RepID=A0A8B7NTG9_HYAAZ|nr:uncharacterized protein LOC108673043 [Hyalella azteca]
MAHLRCVLLCTLISLLKANCTAEVNYLTAASDEPQFPDVWTVVEHSYHAKILMSLPQGVPPVTATIDELYDRSLGSGRVLVTGGGMDNFYHYYESSQQMFIITNHSCQSYPLKEPQPLYGWNYQFEPDNFLFGPSALLSAAKILDPTYVGSDTIRDIASDVWTANTIDGYTISYYFAVQQWSIGHGGMRIPLLIKVDGMETNPWDILDHKNMSIFYDYMDFVPDVSPEHYRDLELPKGLECSSRKSLDEGKQLPDLPLGFRTHMEIILGDKSGQIVYRGWMYYDTTRQLLRFDLKGDDVEELEYDMKLIFAYDSGILYAINSYTGDCKMSPIKPGYFGSLEGSVVGNILMADPDHFFHLDDTWSQNGSGSSWTRGVLTERWTSTRNDIPNPEGGNYPKVVLDYHFIRSDVLIIGHADDVSVQHPVRVDVTIYDPDDARVVVAEEAVNFLGFSSLASDSFAMGEFDVRECFMLPQQRSWLKITFEGIWERGLDTHVRDFEEDLARAIINGTGTSIIRIPEIQVDHDDNFVFAVLLLLQPAPYSLQFTPYPDKQPTDQDHLVEELINDADLCARYCLSYTTFHCSSFYQCPVQGKQCFLSSIINSTGTAATDVPCPHFVQTVSDTHAVQPFNEEVEMWINEEIVKQTLVFQYPYTDADGQENYGVYTAVQMTREMFVDDPVFVDLIREDFVPLIGGARLKDEYNNVTFKKDTYISCLLTCKYYEAFECNTFSFCYDDGTCYLSSQVFVRPMTPQEVVLDGDCIVIGRQLLDEYTEIKGAVLNIDANMQFSGILDPNYCAYDCDVVTDFVCRSFDYCSDTGTCYLHDTHVLDAGDGDLQTNATHCTHYSSSYLTDFKKHENVRISGTRDVYLLYVTLDQCAKECVEDADIVCNGFDFCQEDGGQSCYLTEAHYSGQGVQVSDTLVCDHYERVYYDGQDLNTVVNQQEPKKGYGPGDMAGLAVGMLISSFALTFVAFYFYNKPH